MSTSAGSAAAIEAGAAPGLLLEEAGRAALWVRLIEIVEAHIRGVPGLRVAPALDPAALRALLDPLDFTEPLGPVQALDIVADALAEHQSILRTRATSGCSTPRPRPWASPRTRWSPPSTRSSPPGATAPSPQRRSAT